MVIDVAERVIYAVVKGKLSRAALDSGLSGRCPRRVTTASRWALADDHAVVRGALRMHLDAEPGLDVIGEAEDFEWAVRYTRGRKPRVLVLDLNMPAGSALEVIEELRESSPDTAVVAVTMQAEPEMVREVMRAGALGYVLKGAGHADLIAAITEAAAGRTYLQPELGARLAAEPVPESDELTPREQEVVALIARGHTNRAIAERLFLSVRTVESHRARIQEKLGVTKRSELVSYARARGLLDG